MKKIIHVSDIAASPEDVYAALTTSEGLGSWWSDRVDASTQVGGIVDFTFLEGFNPDMRIEALDPPAMVRWRCVAGHEPWDDNTFSFRLRAHDGGTRLTFEQVYAQELSDEQYGIYNYNWGYYLESLRRYAETGEGTPHTG